jgi:hypothetical protein
MKGGTWYTILKVKSKLKVRKTDYSYTDKINELRLDVSHPNSSGRVFVFLEGDSDVRLYRKLFNTEVAKIEVIPGGKNKLQEGMIELQKNYPLIIAIRDADFLHYDGEEFQVAGLFLTDYHDLEISSIACDNTFVQLALNFVARLRKKI